MTGVKTTVTKSVKTPVALKWSIELSYSYERSTTVSRSETKTIALSVAQTANAPPKTDYTATLLVTMGTLPPTVYKTTAERWYGVPVAGAVQDPAKNNWYKRVEPITVTLRGALATHSTVRIEATPIA